MVIHIEDGRDPRLAPYAGVREPALLRDSGLLIAEGRFVVRRLLELQRNSVQSLLLNQAALHALSDALAMLDASINVYVATPEVITEATGFNMHRGCLAVAQRPADVPVQTILDNHAFVAVLERVVDADNVGSVFRSAEAFGVESVLLSPGCCDPFYRKALRTSSGAALVVPCAAAVPWPDSLEQLRAAGFAVLALTPHEQAIDIGEFVATAAAVGRIAVLLGTEGQGLTEEALAHADVRIRIPMSSTLDSLNIATAAGIALHRLHEVRTRKRS